MSHDPRALKIYIDGSALKNPGGAGGFAAWVEFPMDWNRPDEQLFQQGFQETTNNRMELLACIRAFEYVRGQGRDLRVERVQIVTDSKYVHDWFFLAERWRKNGWRNLDGKPVENRDLWKQLLSVRSKVTVRTELKWMPGKKSPILKSVDRAAKIAASQPWETDRGFKSGKVGRSTEGSRRAAASFLAKGQHSVIRIYRSKLVGSDHKIYFEVWDTQLSRIEEKAWAFASAEVAVDLHRHHSYRVLFNANPKYPIIERIMEEVEIPKIPVTPKKEVPVDHRTPGAIY
jgi:ribonuclease HI